MTKNHKKILAGLLASVVSVSQASGYAAEMSDGSNVQFEASETSGTENEPEITDGTNIQDETSENMVETPEAESNPDTRSIFLNILSAGGSVIIDEGEADEQNVRLEQINDSDVINVYDINETLILSEDAADNGYIYMYETEADSIVNVKAVAETGYKVTEYHVYGDELEEDTGFVSPMQEFQYPVFLSEDRTVKVGFHAVAEKEEKPEDETESSLNDETNANISEDIIVNESEEESSEGNNTGNDTQNAEGAETVQPTEMPGINGGAEEEGTGAVRPEDNGVVEGEDSEVKNEEMTENDNDTAVTEPMTEAGENVEPVMIEYFNCMFSEGADNVDGKYVYNPSEPTKDHAFIYRIEYSMSGEFSTDKGAFKIEVPLHTLKNRDGNWADTFDCPYFMESEITEDMAEPEFAYSIDEENNKVTIYNYAPHPTGDSGFIEISYKTNEQTFEYVDMAASDSVHAKVYATNEASTVTAEADAEPVYIDTHATLAYTQKRTPDYYEKWNDTWGEKPDDADDYVYLIWVIRSNINKCTGLYDFILDDSFNAMEGNVVGYRFEGQKQFSSENCIYGLSDYGDRYDSVLTRHRKDLADEIVNAGESYEIKNNITATVHPVDGIDTDTSSSSSNSWWYEKRLLPVNTGEGFYAQKYGIIGKYEQVDDSEDVTNYSLADFQTGIEETLDNLRYYVYGNSKPYPWTLADGAQGTIEDAVNGLFGQKKVDGELIDNELYLENTEVPLNDEDYNFTGLELSVLMRTAVFDETNSKFIERAITEYREEDSITLWLRTGTDIWTKAAVYDMRTKDFTELDTSLIKTEESTNKYLKFSGGIKGFKLTYSNPYYHTMLKAYPEISLNRTENVLALIGQDSGKTKVSLTNKATFRVFQGDKTIFEREVSAKDYMQKVVQESEIRKDIVQTQNLKKESAFSVTWNVSVQEKYTDEEGVHSIYQQSGKFYDLLPIGTVLNQKSISVTASGRSLLPGGYTVDIIDNYMNSGRTMLMVDVLEPTNNKYILSYTTLYSYDSIKDYGKNLLNSAAYETGNDRIAEGYPDDGGEITDKDLFIDIDKNTDARKFLYTEARYNVAVTVASSTGLKKQVKSLKDKQYSYSTTVNVGEDYSYQVRLANDSTTQSKDIIFFDSLENFYQKSSETSPTIPSDWKGVLQGIDLTNMRFKGINPKVYLSNIEGLNPQNHHNLSEVIDGKRVWVRYETFQKQYGLESATAIAIDASMTETGEDFILGLQESVSFLIYMKSPASDTTQEILEPTAYNNIYVQRTAIREDYEGTIEISQFFHQDYTSAKLRVVGDIHLKKVDRTDMEAPVKDAVYRLTGTSDYGTEYKQESVSDRNGNIVFSDIERGTYTLTEIQCSDDWQLNTEKYTVVVSQKGTVAISGLEKDENGIYLLSDEPRIHADLNIKKYDDVSKYPVDGTEFKLTGTSDYGNQYLEYTTSDVSGKVSFKNIELGTYQLYESKAVDGYIKKVTPFTVKIEEPGIAFLYDGNTKLESSSDGDYIIYNEPYHEIRFLKSSSYGKNIYLEGAEFSLTGISDYGNSVNKTAVSSAAEDGGLIVFDKLEPGTYTIKETKAPEDHELDTKSYTVTVYKDGSYEIAGLSKTQFGSAEVYDFKNTKTTGTICVTKEWEDEGEELSNRFIPDISISTRIPSSNPLGYTITFDANGGSFGDGTTTRDIVYNSSNMIVDGSYVKPSNGEKVFVGWYTDRTDGELVDISDDGIPVNELTSDMTLYARYKTVVLKKGTDFKALIPSEAKSAKFVYEKAPDGATLINVDEDGDGGVVGWVDGDVFKISTQIDGVKAIANVNCFKMFNDSKLESITCEALDTSQTTNMQEFFSGCQNLTYLDVSSFDTRNVTNMMYMFHFLTKLPSLDVSMLDTSNVTNMFAMFGNCEVLTKLDVSNFKTDKVTDMQEMFRGCFKLTSLDLSNFNTANVTTMKKMFYDCHSVQILDVSGFDTSNVKSTYDMFYNCSSVQTLDVSGFETGNVTFMYCMFYNCSSVQALDVSGFDTSNVTYMASMFYNCSSVQALDVSGFDTSNVTNMAYMFSNCSSVQALDVSGFDTSNVTNMSYMFYNCSSVQALDVSGFETGNVTNMAYMFNTCTSIQTLDVSGLDTSNVTSMRGMFSNCPSIQTLDVSGFGTSNVTSMHGMFYRCHSLEYLDLSGFDTSNVTDMHGMFYECSSLEYLDVSGFNTSNVTDMQTMFYYCRNLKTLDVSNFNTSNVTGMEAMFNMCQNLQVIDVSNFNTDNVTNMRSMFLHCQSVQTLDLSNFNTANVTDMHWILYGTRALQSISFGKDFAFTEDSEYLKVSGYGVPGYNGNYWYNSSGEQILSSEIPPNVADTYYATADLVP